MQDISASGGEWALERDRFIVLLHLYNVRETDPAASLAPEKITRDLGLSRDRAELLIGPLVAANFLSYSGSGEGLILTPEAVNYIEHEAGRRRSVRLLK